VNAGTGAITANEEVFSSVGPSLTFASCSRLRRRAAWAALVAATLGGASCGADNLDDFATVSATSCTGVIDSAGTLHYSVHARVSAPFGIGQRDVTLMLVVDRNGHVFERP
jgi:hypothetical protein